MQIRTLLRKVFDYKDSEKITFLCDLPGEDNKDWKWRRQLAEEWHSQTDSRFAYFRATGSNNAQLPEKCAIDSREELFDNVMKDSDIVIALTEYSATAPLHSYAKKYGLRAASMPGFTKKMMPALGLDFDRIAKKVNAIYELLNEHSAIRITFDVRGEKYPLYLDIKDRKAIKDDGSCKKPGTVINLPSGEAFIAPLDTEKSLTGGYLPIQASETVIYKVYQNKIIDTDKQTPLMQKIKQDPAVGNIAEIGFGVLGSFGLKPTGRILLDEKLGLHIALGRNDHFGGNIGPNQFNHKENVWHQDYVYIKQVQPDVKIVSILLLTKNKQTEMLNHLI